MDLQSKGSPPLPRGRIGGRTWSPPPACPPTHPTRPESPTTPVPSSPRPAHPGLARPARSSLAAFLAPSSHWQTPHRKSMQARQWKVERASQVLGGIHRSGAHRRSLGPRCPPSNLQALSQLSSLSQGHWVTQHPNKSIVFHTRFRNNEDLVQAPNKRLLGTGARLLVRSLARSLAPSSNEDPVSLS